MSTNPELIIEMSEEAESTHPKVRESGFSGVGVSSASETPLKEQRSEPSLAVAPSNPPISSSARTTTLYALYEHLGCYEFQIHWVNDKTLENLAIMNTEEKIILWAIPIPEEKLNSKFYLKLIFDRSLRNGYLWKEYPDQQENRRFDGKFSHVFLFDLKFSRFPPGQTLHSKEHYLIYYAKGLFKSPEYEVTVPQLILQYRFSKPSERRYQIDDIRLIFSELEVIIREFTRGYCPRFIGCILSVLGSITFVDSVKYPGHAFLLSCLNEEFAGSLLEYQDKNYVSAILKGISYCLRLNFSDSTSADLPLPQIPSEMIEELLKYILEFLRNANEKSISICCALIQRLPSQTAEPFIAKLLENGSTKRHILLILSQMRILFPYSEANATLVSKAFAKSMQNDVTAQDLRLLLDTIKENSSEWNKFFSAPQLQIAISSFFQFPKAADLDIYKRLLVTEFDDWFLQKVDLKSFYMKYFTNLSLGIVVNDLNPEESVLISSFSTWATQKLSIYYYGGTSIADIDRELTVITQPQIAEKLSNIAGEIFVNGVHTRKENILKFYPDIDSLKTKALQVAIIAQANIKGLVKIESQGIQIHMLLELKAKNPTSWTLDNFVKLAFLNVEPPSYIELERKLAVHVEDYWRYLLQGYDSYSLHESIRLLFDRIEEFAKNVVKKHLSIEILLTMKARSNDELEDIMTFLMNVLNLRKIALRVELAEAAKSAIIEAETIKENLQKITEFLLNTIPDLRESGEVMSLLTKLESEYKSKKLDEFRYPPELETVLKTADEVFSISKSSIYLFFIGKLKDARDLTLDNVAEICMTAHQDLNNYLSENLESISSLPISQLIYRFQQFRPSKAEIFALINEFPHLSSQLRILDECFQFETSTGKLYSNCAVILSLKKMLEIEEVPAILEAQKFIKKFPTIMTLPVEEVMELYHTTEQFLYPDSQRQERESAFGILGELFSNEGLMLFLSRLTPEKFNYLYEGVNYHEDQMSVTTSHLNQLGNVFDFVSKLKSTAKNLKELISAIATIRRDEKFQEIVKDAKSCSLNLQGFLDLFTDLECKEENTRKQTEAIRMDSHVSFIHPNPGQVYDISLRYEGRKTNLTALLELKDRASLTMHVAKNEHIQGNISFLEDFVSFAQFIQDAVDKLNALSAYGYPDDIASAIEYPCEEGQFEALKLYYSDLEKKLQHWKDHIEKACLQYHHLTYLYGSQFWTMESCLSSQEPPKQIALGLLDYMGKKRRYISFLPSASPYDRLMRLGQNLSELEPTMISERRIFYEAPPNAKLKDYIGKVLYASVISDRFLYALLSIYMHTDAVFPAASQVLFCTHSTTWPELQMFAYRCFTCPASGKIYTLIGCENLSLEVQVTFKSLFQKLRISHVSHFSMAIVTSNDKCHLSEYFRLLESPKTIKIRDSQLIMDDAVLSNIVQQVDDHESKKTLVVYSQRSGLGKSHWIRNQANQEHVNLIKFPISGTLDLSDICKDLIQVVGSGTGMVSHLHIIINHVDNFEVLHHLLISLTMFRVLRAGDLIITLPTTWKLYLELANLQVDWPTKIPLLKYLSQKEIQFNIEELYIDPKIRIVATYLKYLDNGTINNRIPDPQETVTKEVAIQLLSKYFLKPKENERTPISYSSIIAFFRTLHTMMQNFEASPFSPDLIQIMIADLRANAAGSLIPEYSTLRQQIMEALVKTTFEVTTQCLGVIPVAQRQDQLNAPAQYARTLTWEQSNHFSMIFLTDGSNLAIYRDKEKVSPSFRKLIYIQTNCQSLLGKTLAANIQRNQYEIVNYGELTHLQLLEKLKTYTKSGSRLESETALLQQMETGDLRGKSRKEAEEIYAAKRKHPEQSIQFCNPDYVITPDNFLKMNLIYIRAISQLPVVLMGETGCGKTSLVRFFVQYVLEETLRIVNIHAGITSAHLTEYIEEIQIEATKYPRLWAFFDEFNTSDCVGQISEILCEHSFLGKPLPYNLITIAACNPFRDQSMKINAGDTVGIKKSQKYQGKLSNALVYMVKPLPDTVRETLWDFGSLTREDTGKYIQSMLKTLNSRHAELFTALVFTAHDYFLLQEDADRVSLRDVARFTILYNWYKTSVLQRRALVLEKRYCDNLLKYGLDVDWSCLEDEEIAAGVLALCGCYYFRLSKLAKRVEFLERISGVHPKFTPEFIKKLIKLNEDDLMARMELPSSTALNQAFRENVTAIVTCIFNKIALFICGKPGCSKSLAVQVVFANFQGKRSVDLYFRSLPRLVIIPFQGSESCTSESVEKVFKRAKDCLKNPNADILPVVVFDEIGLAEISDHNPLKVLHSLLELENREVGFVGISNWRLDASKMNRAIYLARPTPDEQELIFTAQSILVSTTENVDIKSHSYLISRLATTYYRFTEELKESKSADFYGLRDFYHLIKQVATGLAAGNAPDTKQQTAIVKKAIERNFGGKKGETERFGHILLQLNRALLDYYAEIPVTPTLDLILENLDDKRARFLMLICKGDIATYVLQKYLGRSQSEQRVLIGSHMSRDESKEDYRFKDLKDIILFMEKGISVVLKDMDHIYTSLYDLFNQNFAYFGENRCCKVALGAQTNPRCPVHDKFHVIVLLSDDDERLEQYDAPFLNRFEKHRFDIDQLESPANLALFDEVQDWVRRLMTLESKRKVLISLNYLFPLYSESYLKLLILFLSEEDSKGNIAEKCKFELLKMGSQELISLAHSSVLEYHEKSQIYSLRNKLLSDTLISYLAAAFARNKKTGWKSVVFTSDLQMLNSEDLEELSKSGTNAVYEDFELFKSKHDIEMALNHFFQDDSKQLYILDFNFTKDSNHLAMIKFILEKAAKDYQTQPKQFCLLARVMRNAQLDADVWWFGDWEIQSITSIRKEKIAITEELCSANISDLCQNEALFTFEFNKLTFEAYQQIRFLNGNTGSQKQLNQHIFLVIDNLERHGNVTSAIKSKIISLLEGSSEPKKWVEEVLCNSECYTGAVDFPAAINKAIELEVLRVYTLILFMIENQMAFHCIFTLSPDADMLQSVWISVFQEMPCPYTLQTLKQSNVLPFPIALDFPFSLTDHRFLEMLFNQCGNLENKEEAYFKFLREFREKSVLRFNLEAINNAPEARQTYIRDLVRIDLSTRNALSGFEDILVMILRSLGTENSNIEEETFFYMENRHFLFLICEAFDHFQALGINASEQVQVKLIELYETNSQSILREEEKTQDLYERESVEMSRTESLDEHKSDSSSINETTPKKQVKSLLAEVLELSISQCYPIKLSLKSSKHMQDVSAGLNKLYQLYLRFKCDYEVNLNDNCLHSFLIWKLLYELLLQVPTGHDVLNEIGREAQEVDEANGSFLYNEKFGKFLSDTVQKYCPATSQDFKSCYYMKLLISEQSGAMQLIAKQIDCSDKINEFWKYSATLLQIVIEQCGLLPDEGEVLFEFTQSADLDELESILLQESQSSRFAILLNDTLVRILDPGLESMNDKEKEQFIINKEQEFHTVKDVLCTPQVKYPLIIKEVGSAFVRVYVEAYCQIVCRDPDLSEEGDRLVKLVSTFLSETYFPAARLYALKYIKHFQQLTDETIVDFIRERPSLTWMSYFSFSEKQEEIISPELQGSTIYQKTAHALKLLAAGRVQLDISEVLTQLTTPEAKASFALAFLVNVYLPYAKNKDNRRISDCFQTIRTAVEMAVGQALCRLIELFVSNFPEDSLLYLTSETKDLYMKVPLAYYLVITLSYCAVESPLTNVFFDKKGIVLQKIVDILDSAYLYGVGTNPLYDYLQDLKENFDTQKSTTFMNTYSRGGTNKCSDTCDYVYIITKCGGPTQTGKCPYCGSEIGGRSHKWIDRKGHQNLSDEEALAFLEQKTSWYKETQQERGYWDFEVGKSSPQLRDISSLAHKILHLFLNAMLYFLKLAQLIPEDAFPRIVHTKSTQPVIDIKHHLSSSIQTEFKEIQKSLDIADEQFWWLALVSQLPIFMKNHNQYIRDLRIRTEFESDFDALIGRNRESPVSVVLTFKKNAKNFSRNAVALLDEAVSAEEMSAYPCFEFFRMIRSPDIQSLKADFDLQQLEKKHPLLALYFTFRSEFTQLDILSPAIELTNYLRNKFSHIKSRKEAKDILIKNLIKEDDSLQKLYQSFTLEWNEKHPSSLQFDCHLLPNKKFDEDDEMSYFMIDNQELGYGMYMAATLTQLGELQNRVLDAFLRIMSSKTGLEMTYFMDQQGYKVQEARLDMIIQLSLEDKNTLNCAFVNNPEYGQGNAVIYNYKKMEDIVLECLVKGRKLRTEPLSYVQYVYEVLATTSENSDLISTVRQVIPQEPFSEIERQRVELFYDRVEKENSKQYPPLLRNYYGTLESLLCSFRISTPDPEMKISEFAAKVKRYKTYDLFLTKTNVSDVRLKTVIALYELLEVKLYPFFKKYLPEEYNEKSPEVEKRISGLDFSDLPKKEEVKLAMMRLIMRLLHGQLLPSLELSLYIGRSDFWKENRNEEQIEKLKEKIGGVTFAYAVQVYETISNPKKELPAVQQHQKNPPKITKDDAKKKFKY